MDLLTIFFSTFLFVFIGELGDKTQIAAGTGTLANKRKIGIIFFSSSFALIAVAGITVYFAGLIPENTIPYIKKVGGALLVVYGTYLYTQSGKADDETEESSQVNDWALFLSHFSVVFMAEMGDKTQIATLAVAIENQSHLFTVFLASGSALVTVTGITVWGVTKIPSHWVIRVQQIGAFLMVIYGMYMFV